MFRTKNCGELRLTDINHPVTLCGWVQRVRDKGGLVWIDLRDRYGITQLILEDGVSKPELLQIAKNLGRESVVQAQGMVIERASKNDQMPTGAIEVKVTTLEVLNPSALPPFLIESDTDGSEALRLQYRYLDIRRTPLKENLILRHHITKAIRFFLDDEQFIEVETPILIKSTPEGARDFIVPSRLQPGHCYALPQSPQTFKQLLMIGGLDRYYQIVKCFRDEDFRADRQPEFTQIDCELSFITQEEVLQLFESLMKSLFLKFKSVTLPAFPVLSYQEAMEKYGSDKPDLRFGMAFFDLTAQAQGKGFKVFDEADIIKGICVKEKADFSRKQLDALTDFVRQPQVGAQGLVYVKYNSDGTFKSSVDKFFNSEQLKTWAETANAKPGDLLLLLAGKQEVTLSALSSLRLHVADLLELRPKDQFAPLWVVDFPLLEWDEETQRYHAKHHPFTSPKEEDIAHIDQNPLAARANAYDLVINGMEVGGGSIRIHQRPFQEKMFELLGFSPEEAQEQFGFLMDALTFGAPPHGGIAIGLDRLCAIIGGQEAIRDFMAFPKNNSGRDVMINAPAPMHEEQLKELGLQLKK